MEIGDDGRVSNRRAKPWIPWAAGALTFFITLIIGGLVVADWGLRTAELNTIITRIEASEAAMGQVSEEVDAAFSEHSQAGASPAERAKLDSELRAIATEGRDAIEAAASPIADVVVLPWHSAIEQAQVAYLIHNLAWQEYLDAAAEDPAEFLRPQPLVDSTFLDAEQPLIDAIPLPDVFDVFSRISAIYAPPELGPGQTQQALA
jgi:hypothetical protein